MKHYFCLVMVLGVCSLAFLMPAHGQSGCDVRDSSYQTEINNCGVAEYSLGVEVDMGVRFEEDPEAVSYGACIGGYYNCNNIYIQKSYIEGKEQFNDDGPLGDEEEYVSWTLDDWIVTDSSCNNGNPQDVNEVSIDYQFQTEEFDVFCG